MKTLYGIAGDGRASRHLQRYFGLLGIPYKLWHRRSGLTPEAVLAPCSTVFVLLPDAAIKTFIAAHPFLNDKTLIHFSGSISLPGVFAMHPFRALSGRVLTLDQYKAIPLALDPGVSLKRLVPEFSNPVLRVRPEDKPLYHALCVIGANLPVLLWSRAAAGLSAFGVTPEAAAAYFRASLDNYAADPGGALTGPLARGDRATIRSNIKALGRDPYGGAYSAFARAYLRGKDRKNVVEKVDFVHAHTVLATPRLGPRAYASSGLRQGFAYPSPSGKPGTKKSRGNS
ncbi:MAG: DUF2520 domain-containing protein [Elusimicrobiales bacterium]